MTGRLTSLYAAMLLGELPAWPTHEIISAGEELRELVRDDVPKMVTQAAGDRAELERIDEILIACGALDKNDRTTGAADLIEALLPPLESGE